MSKKIRDIIENAHELWREDNHRDKNFHEDAKKLKEREIRILEVSKGSDLLKVTRIYHHCKEVLNNQIIPFLDKTLNDKSTSVSEKNKFIKADYIMALSARIDATLCEAMIERFPELNEYARRWEAWKVNYNNKLQEIWNVTEAVENTKRAKLKFELFEANYYSQHNVLKDLIYELIFMTDGAKAYIYID